MKVYQLAVALIALVVVREIAGDLLMRTTGLPVVANFGGLVIASFFAGWLAGVISKLGPSNGQLWGLAALGVIAAIGIGFMQGASFLAPVVVIMALLFTPLSYFCLLLGARLAEVGTDVKPSHQEDHPVASREASGTSAEDSTAAPERPSQDRLG
jgi:hypothetical protein